MDRTIEETLRVIADRTETDTEMGTVLTGTPAEIGGEGQELIEPNTMAMGNEGSARRL